MAGGLDADFDAAEDLDKAFDAAPDVGHHAPPTPGIPTSTPDGWSAAASGTGKGLTFGFGDELGAAEQAALMKLTGNGDFGETYRRARDENRAEDKAATKEHPWIHGLSALAGTVPSAVLGAPFKVGQGAGLLSRTIIGAGNGLVGGAAFGAGDSEAKDAAGVAHDTEVGGAWGSFAGGALPLLGRLAGAGVSLAKKLPYAEDTVRLGESLLGGFAKRSDTVQRLKALGVDTSKLSLGQQAPASKLDLIEMGAEHGDGTDAEIIRRARNAGRGAWQDAVLKRIAPPGFKPPEGDIYSKVDAAANAFDDAYAPIKESAVTTAGPGEQSLGDQLRHAFKGTVQDPSVLASDSERGTIGNFLDDQATRVGFEPGRTPTVGPLLKIRSFIRARDRGLQPGNQMSGLLGNAEDAVTEQISRNLEPAQAEHLGTTDAAYRQFIKTAGAIKSARGSPHGFTPNQLMGSVAKDLSAVDFARGRGGELRDLAQAGREVLEPSVPNNGARNAIPHLPYISKHLLPNLVAKGNEDPATAAWLLGEAPTQLRVRALIQALRASPSAQTLGRAALREPSLLLGQESR